jgi:hypothetical protein
MWRAVVILEANKSSKDGVRAAGHAKERDVLELAKGVCKALGAETDESGGACGEGAAVASGAFRH